MTKTTAAWLQNNHRTFVLVALWLDNRRQVRQNFPCQGPWNVDLRTPPGPEGSNGSLLCVCRGHPDTFSNDEGRMKNEETNPVSRMQIILASSFFILHSSFVSK